MIGLMISKAISLPRVTYILMKMEYGNQHTSLGLGETLTDSLPDC